MRLACITTPAVTIEKDGRIADMYRKMHIPDDPLCTTKFRFAPSVPTGLQGHRDDRRKDRHASLLGPVVPRGRAANRSSWRGDTLPAHRHRLASIREG